MGHSQDYVGNKNTSSWILSFSFILSVFHCTERWSTPGVSDVQSLRMDEALNTQQAIAYFPNLTHKHVNV